MQKNSCRSGEVLYCRSQYLRGSFGDNMKNINLILENLIDKVYVQAIVLVHCRDVRFSSTQNYSR